MRDLLDRLVEALLLTGPSDPQGLRTLRRRMDELLAASTDGRVAETVVDLGILLDFLITGKDPEAERSWKTLESGVQKLQDLLAGSGEPDLDVRAAAPTPALDPEILAGFVVEAREHLDAAEAQLLALESDPAQADGIHPVFRAFHTIKGAAACLDLGGVQDLAHETETLLDLARRGDIPAAGSTLDLVFEAVDLMKRLVWGVEEFLKTGTKLPAEAGLESLVGRIRERASLDAGPSERPDDRPAAGGAPAATAGPSGEDKASLRESVRVDADRLDRLVDLIGELVIAESMVSQSTELRNTAGGGVLGKSISQLDKITRELQEIGMSLRMVPVRPLFQKMARLARDVSRKLGKPVDFVTSGEDIEIDKAIVNCVTDALVHIIRNAVDHGIEADADARRRAGKVGSGRIELRAAHREGAIVIEVEDDGRGLDREAILAKGVEKGLVAGGSALTGEEIFKLIFLPGFSTANVVTELSGRGVGLDVVRTSVEGLRGRIDVRSKKGRGTIFRLRLPLTLAIIDGMVIRSGRERFIVPTLSITRLVRPDDAGLTTALGKGEMLTLQDEVIPLFRLRDLLGVSDPTADEGAEVVVVVEDAGRRAGLAADEVLGQQQVVIKSLGLNLEGVQGISGGVILADGQVGLILDVPALLGASRSGVDPVAALPEAG